MSYLTLQSFHCTVSFRLFPQENLTLGAIAIVRSKRSIALIADPALPIDHWIDLATETVQESTQMTAVGENCTVKENAKRFSWPDLFLYDERKQSPMLEAFPIFFNVALYREKCTRCTDPGRQMAPHRTVVAAAVRD